MEITFARLTPPSPVRFSLSVEGGASLKIFGISVADAVTGRSLWVATLLKPPSGPMRTPKGDLSARVPAPLTAADVIAIDNDMRANLSSFAAIAGPSVSEITYGELPEGLHHLSGPTHLEAGRRYVLAILGTVNGSVEFSA